MFWLAAMLVGSAGMATQRSERPISYYFDTDSSVLLVEPVGDIARRSVQDPFPVRVVTVFKGNASPGDVLYVYEVPFRGLLLFGNTGGISYRRGWRVGIMQFRADLAETLSLDELVDRVLPVLSAQHARVQAGERPVHLTRGPVPEADPAAARVAARLVPDGCSCGNRYPASVGIDLAEVVVRGTVDAERRTVEVAEVLKGELPVGAADVTFLDPANATCSWWTDAAGKEALLFAGLDQGKLQLGACHLVIPADGASRPDLELYPDAKPALRYDDALQMVRMNVGVQGTLRHEFWDMVGYRASGIVASPALLEP